MTAVRFQSTCPACPNKQYYYWVHHNCGGDLYLDNNAMLFCEDCLKEDYVFRWRFDCGERNNGCHTCGFQNGCLQGFLCALSFIGKLQNPPGNFILDVSKVLMAHQDEFRTNY